MNGKARDLLEKEIERLLADYHMSCRVKTDYQTRVDQETAFQQRIKSDIQSLCAAITHITGVPRWISFESDVPDLQRQIADDGSQSSQAGLVHK